MLLGFALLQEPGKKEGIFHKEGIFAPRKASMFHLETAFSSWNGGFTECEFSWWPRLGDHVNRKRHGLGAL